MMGTNKKLIERDVEVNGPANRAVEDGTEVTAGVGGAEVTVEVEKSTKGLVDWWGVLNLGRAGMMILGMGFGLGGVFLE